MSITEYIANLNRLKQLAIDNWGQLTQVERQIFDDSYDWLIDHLEIRRGEVVVDEDLTVSMNQFLGAVVKIVQENKGYTAKVTSFLSDLSNIQSNNIAFHATTNNFNIDIAGVKEIQKTVVEEIVNQYLGNGLNAGFAAPLRDGIFRNILAGANMKQVREVLRNYILGGQDVTGKLGQYLNQTAQQSVDSYQGSINQQLKATFTFTGYIISGSLIETSSKQCIYAVDHADHGYLTFKDWETVLQIARENPKAKLIAGTTIDNLPLNKLHWGCRHDFTPVIKSDKSKELPKPPAPPKPVKVPKQPGEILTIADGKRTVAAMIAENLGFKVSRVTTTKDLSLERFKKYIAKLGELTNEYKSAVPNKEFGTNVTFRGTSRNYGVVKSIGRGQSITEMNFGDNSDPARSKDYRPETAFLIEKARVDPENQEISTEVHEFAHVMSISQQANHTQDLTDFWFSIQAIKKEYTQEVREIFEKNDDQAFLDITLGNYANTNLNEFMAEGFTEYKLRKNPSKYAKKIGLLIDKYFKK